MMLRAHIVSGLDEKEVTGGFLMTRQTSKMTKDVGSVFQPSH